MYYCFWEAKRSELSSSTEITQFFNHPEVEIDSNSGLTELDAVKCMRLWFAESLETAADRVIWGDIRDSVLHENDANAIKIKREWSTYKRRNKDPDFKKWCVCALTYSIFK